MTDKNPPTGSREYAARTEETRALVDRFIQAWFAADADRLVSLLDRNATWRPPASIGGPVSERDLIAAGLAGAAAGRYVRLETLERTVSTMLVDGDRAAVLVHLEAETLTGASYVNEYTWFLECRDGLVFRITEYADTLHAARLGFVPFSAEEGGSQ
jgi:ketosteroid isomerase-like protein